MAVEKAVSEMESLFFIDDMSMLATASSVNWVCEILQRAAEVAVEWGQMNAVKFDEEKTEAILFTCKKSRALQKQI